MTFILNILLFLTVAVHFQPDRQQQGQTFIMSGDGNLRKR